MVCDIRHYPFDTSWGPLDPHGDPDDDLFDAPLEWDEPTVARVDWLFEPNRDFEVIDAVYWVMAATSRHTFQVLTDHPERAREFFEWVKEEPPPVQYVCAWHANHEGAEDQMDGRFGEYYEDFDWPSPNVWLGTRASDQFEADARIPPLLECPAEGRFVVAGPEGAMIIHQEMSRIDWVVVGGDYDMYVAQIYGQSSEHGVPCFVRSNDDIRDLPEEVQS